VEALDKLYSHDSELHYLMSGCELLRDCTDLVHEELEQFTERGLQPIALAADRMAEEMRATGLRGRGKGVVLPDTPCDAAELLGHVFSLEALLTQAAEAEAAAARDMQRFADECMESLREVDDELERVYSVRIKPLRDAHEKAYDALRAPQRRLETLMAKPEASLAKDKNQRAVESAEAEAQQLQAALRVTTARLKENAGDFLRHWTPRVHGALLGFVAAKARMLRCAAARTDDLAKHTLGGYQEVRELRRLAWEEEEGEQQGEQEAAAEEAQTSAKEE